MRRYLYWLTVALLVAIVVVASPMFLDLISRVIAIDWGLVGQVGETYGGASAVLAALAFVAIAISLMLQASQLRSARVQVVRNIHRDLLRMAMENPSLYRPVIGAAGHATDDDVRQHFYAVLWMNYMRLAFEERVVLESPLRKEMLRGMFTSQSGRDWWEQARGDWYEGTRDSRAERKFYEIVDSEYRRALTLEPSGLSWQERPERRISPVSARSRRKWWVAAVPIAAAAVVLLTPKAGRRLFRRDQSESRPLVG
ncbi:DUF6082 family protein [Microbispora sp. CA-102843]|uniref:DUF6082 family protein n=1 Tax=Microbispora sp. CA-102843 TaxID=3239952 RepID=UPI003D91AB57